MNLYRVKARGYTLKDSEAYVVAPNAEAAYQELRMFFDRNDLMFTGERELESVTLLASDVRYPDCERRLFIAQEPSHGR